MYHRKATPKSHMKIEKRTSRDRTKNLNERASQKPDVTSQAGCITSSHAGPQGLPNF